MPFTVDLEKLIEKNEKTFKYQLPEIIDNINDKVEITILGLPEFVLFDPYTRSLKFETENLDEKSHGNFKTVVVLKDQLKAERKYELEFSVLMPQNSIILNKKPIDKSTDYSPEIEAIIEDSQILSAKIKEISPIGLLTVEFSTEMMTDFNHSLINETVLDLYIQPAMNRSLDKDFNVATVNFTWQVASFKSNILQIQLEFLKPAFISPLIEQDQLVLHFNDTIHFISSTLLT